MQIRFIGEGEFFQNACEGSTAGNACFSGSQELLVCWEMLFCPSFDFGKGGDVGEQSEEHEGEERCDVPCLGGDRELFGNIGRRE